MVLNLVNQSLCELLEEKISLWRNFSLLKLSKAFTKFGRLHCTVVLLPCIVVLLLCVVVLLPYVHVVLLLPCLVVKLVILPGAVVTLPSVALTIIRCCFLNNCQH